MRLTDLIIFYLSIGAPFGVVRYLYGSSGAPRRKLLRSVAHVALWPLFLVYALVKRIASGEPLRKPENSNGADAYKHVGVKDLQRELEILTLDNADELSLFVIREAIERYVALTRAVSNSGEPDGKLFRDLFSVSERTDSEIASLCLSRRNLKRLCTHREQARADVITFVTASSPASRRSQAIRTAQTLFSEMNDDSGVALIRHLSDDGGGVQKMASKLASQVS